MAKKIGIPKPGTIKNLDHLIDSFLDPNWRASCMQFDIPANCQIFGQLVVNAGIEGIVYPSKFTKKKCIALYPQNFDSESFVAIDGEIPEGAQSRLDKNLWSSLKETFH